MGGEGAGDPPPIPSCSPTLACPGNAVPSSVRRAADTGAQFRYVQQEVFCSEKRDYPSRPSARAKRR
eukprot:6383808-Pyramimonas_sp.AAC.1